MGFGQYDRVEVGAERRRLKIGQPFCSFIESLKMYQVCTKS